MPPKPDSSSTEVVQALAPAEEAPTSFELTIEEFCIRKSTEDRRVELLAGFLSDETRSGVVKDSAQNFEARFQAFATRPA